MLKLIYRLRKNSNSNLKFDIFGEVTLLINYNIINDLAKLLLHLRSGI